jgi:hypothetical protein
MLLTTALAAGLMLAGAASAAPSSHAPMVVAPIAPAPPDEPLPPIAEDQAQADAMTAQLAALDARIGADEARLTVLRDAELAKENARIIAIKPALPFGRLHVQRRRL